MYQILLSSKISTCIRFCKHSSAYVQGVDIDQRRQDVCQYLPTYFSILFCKPFTHRGFNDSARSRVCCASLCRSVGDNELDEIGSEELSGARGLRVLRAQRNRLRRPPAALVQLQRLQALWVSSPKNTWRTYIQFKQVFSKLHAKLPLNRGILSVKF